MNEDPKMDQLEYATAFVLGALNPAERTAASTRRLYDKALDRAIRTEEHRLAALEVPAAASPPQAMWDRISAAVEAEEIAFADARPDPYAGGVWEVHNDRIDRKEVWGGKAMLMRCEPGAVEAEHMQDSADDEFILVVAGTLAMGGRTFSTGDTMIVPAGVPHQEMSSKDGCLLLVQYVEAA